MRISLCGGVLANFALPRPFEGKCRKASCSDNRHPSQARVAQTSEIENAAVKDVAVVPPEVSVVDVQILVTQCHVICIQQLPVHQLLVLRLGRLST